MKSTAVSDSPIWDAVYESEVLTTADPDIARQKADLVITAMKQYDSRLEWKREAAKQEARRARINRIWDKTRPYRYGAGVILALASIAFGILFFVNYKTHNDYAGYGPSNVEKHNFNAIRDWRTTSFLDNSILISKQRAEYAGSDAWQSEYKTPSGELCVYVWGGLDPQDKVLEGACR